MRFNTPEQNSRKLQAAQKHLALTQEQHAECLKQMQTLRAKLHAIQGPGIPNDPEQKRERQRGITEARAALDKAIARRDQLRQQLEQAKTDERAEAQRACFELVDSAKPDYSKAVSAYWREYLQRIESEALALHEAFSIREGLGIALGVRRSSKVARLTMTRAMFQRHEEMQVMRAELRELIEAGIVSTKDVPAGLRRTLNL